MKKSVEDIDKLFSLDEEGRFVCLIIPKDKLGEELNLIGRRRLDLSIDEIIRVKQYANKLYQEAL